MGDRRSPPLSGPSCPVESEPVHAVEDGLAGFFGVTLLVGVFDSKDELATILASVEPVEEGGAGTAYVEVAGGRWGETGADGHKL